jgi:hypothetical protein
MRCGTKVPPPLGIKTYCHLYPCNINSRNNHIKKLTFSFFSIPQIWSLDTKGNIINHNNFGKNWWKKIKFNKKKYDREMTINPNFALRNLLLSGDRIMKLYSWKNNLLIHICVDPAEEYPKHGFMVFDSNLKLINDVQFYNDYQFSGVGKYLYFSKILKEDRKAMIVEVLKCDLKL